MVCYCSTWQKINNIDSETEIERQLLGRFVDDINCTVSGEPDSSLREVNSLHTKLAFTAFFRHEH